MFGILNTMCAIGFENNIFAGYAFIKSSALKKLNKMRMPIFKINKYKSINSVDKGCLNNYHTSDDIPVPSYYITKYAKQYCNRVLEDRSRFSQLGENIFRIVVQDGKMSIKTRIKSNKIQLMISTGFIFAKVTFRNFTNSCVNFQGPQPSSKQHL